MVSAAGRNEMCCSLWAAGKMQVQIGAEDVSLGIAGRIGIRLAHAGKGKGPWVVLSRLRVAFRGKVEFMAVQNSSPLPQYGIELHGGGNIADGLQIFVHLYLAGNDTGHRKF